MVLVSKHGKQNDRDWLYAAIFVAIVLRITWAALVPVIPVSDSVAYDTFATNLAAGDGFGWTRENPTGFFAPGAAFIYAVLYVVFGHNYAPIVGLHILVAAASILLLWSLARQWFGIYAANCSAWALALWPSQVMFVTVLATELIFSGLMLASMWVWSRESINIWLRVLILGPILALCALVRPHALLLPAVFALERIWRTGLLIQTAISSAVCMLLVIIILTPWSLRNERVFGERFLIAANSGVTLWMGNNPQSSGEYMYPPTDVEHLNDAQRDKELRRRALAYIIDRPVTFVWQSIVRLVKTHSRETINVVWNIHGIEQGIGSKAHVPLKILSTAYWYVMLIFGLIGVVFIYRRTGLIGCACHPAVLVWMYFSAVHAIVLAQDRYHFISIPMIAALVGYSIAKLSAGNTRPFGTASACKQERGNA